MTSQLKSRPQLILEAAISCFIESGFHLTSMDRIARAAQISPALIYRHFVGKQEIILAIVIAYEEEMQRELQLAAAEADSLQALRLFFRLDWLNDLQASREGVLHLEIMAEATRNVAAAAVLRRSDTARRLALEGILLTSHRSQHAAQSARAVEDASVKAELLLALADGLEARAAFATDEDSELGPALAKSLESLFIHFLGLPAVH
jgi:AcrR family transcriptional regulator